jgi:hypothetical protein
MIFFLNIGISILRRRQAVHLRPIEAYEAIADLTGLSVEAARPLHIAYGNATAGADSTLLALAASEFINQTARQTTIGDAPTIVTANEVSALPLGVDTMRRAYESQKATEQFNEINVRWYPGGENSLAAAAGIMALQTDEKIGAHLLVGSFGAEMALIADIAHRQDRPVLASSDRLEGQAVAYALADYPLLGEEIFQAGSYIGKNDSFKRRTAILDTLRWLTALAILGVMLFTFTATGGA